MNREFLQQYERELEYLYDHAKDFSDKYPGIAERLGGLTREGSDPGVLGLIEGSAYLAARVQLKIKSQFSQFTQELLEQLLPGYLTSIPSVMMVQATPQYDNLSLVEGHSYKAGEYIDANYVEKGKDISCRYRISEQLDLWPIEISEANYSSTPVALQTLGLEVTENTVSGLQIKIRKRSWKLDEDGEGEKSSGTISDLELDNLTIHLGGSDADNAALYEQLFADCVRVSILSTNNLGVNRVFPLHISDIGHVGFDDDQPLFVNDDRTFAGFDLLREFFVFPDKFVGFRLLSLRKIIKSIDENEFSVLFEFDKPAPQLEATVRKTNFKLFSTPASNLFEMQCSRIQIKNNAHEYPIVADRSRWLDYEIIRVKQVYAHYRSIKQKIPVNPIYKLPIGGGASSGGLYFSNRTLARRPTDQEKRHGLIPDYMGTDTFLTFSQPFEFDNDDRVRELSIRAYCCNRHLPCYLPVGESQIDFYLVNDKDINLHCTVGPTMPKEPIVDVERFKTKGVHKGDVLWRLINLLSFNHLGLTSGIKDDKTAGIRELLTLFADLTDTLDERRIRGIVGVDTRPIVKHLRQPSGFNAARGLEVTITFDEKPFEDIGVLLLGTVLERFFAQYCSINSFTQTIIKSTQRGVVKTFPPRSGTGVLF